ncbi:hypothetical protein H0H87_012648 [Tephrocybe sp. NHM501043]|nr:hypothetical protein H0H87_012648 [Tephrocybe sp. NHM501043]
MSTPFPIEDLIANNDDRSSISKLPYFSVRTDFYDLDPLEYLLVPEHDLLDLLFQSLGRIDTFEDIDPKLKATSYNYTLYYLDDKITFTDSNGNKCDPGRTVVTSSMHPCLTIAAANRFFLGKCASRDSPAYTGFDLQEKEEWHDTAYMLFGIYTTFIRSCPPYTFYATNRALDQVRPTPRYYLDDTEEARKNNRVVQRPWDCIEPAEVEAE